MGDVIILLDFNDIFGIKVVPTFEKEEHEIIPCNPHYHFLIRPGIREFLSFLREKYTVGILSSTNYSNISQVLGVIDPDFKTTFTPLLDRAFTTLEPNYGTDPDVKSHDTIKILSTFWSNPVHNRERKWSDKNTLIIDNDSSKLRFNNQKNVLIVEPYTIGDDNDTLDDIVKMIEQKVAEL